MSDLATSRLGRGLESLLGDHASPVAAEALPGEVSRAPIGRIEPNPQNPRSEFERASLDDLAASLRRHGMVQPIVVRPPENGRYRIVAGERRWRAAQLAGLHDVPIVIMDVDERRSLEIAIVENVQRTDLNPVEEAQGYKALMEAFSYAPSDLAEMLGRSRSHVANMVRLLKLPEPVLELVRDESLSMGHARALINAADPLALARRAIAEDLSVREVEKLAARGAEDAAPAPKAPAPKDANAAALEAELRNILGLAVDLRHRQGGKGELRIKYTSLDQLDDVCRRLKS